jgi:hypothetical protein
VKRTYRFVEAIRFVHCPHPAGGTLTIPVIPGILKHPRVEALPGILVTPGGLRKYTDTALRKASWPVLRQFPLTWLRECMDHTDLPPARRKALEFLLF